MPELPEVQTIVGDLRKSIRGWKVTDFYSVWERNVFPGARQLKKNLVGNKIKDITRRGKYILFHFDNGGQLLVHLRMTGSLIAQMQNSKIKMQNNINKSKHLRHCWHLKKRNKNLKLCFFDIRKFGTIEFLEKGQTSSLPGIRSLGIEPLENGFTASELRKILRRYPQKEVRQLLLQQEIIAGIGNIYASEILFDAKIYPRKRAGELTSAEAKKLRDSIRKVLLKAIEKRGTTISDYRDSQGERGSFQNSLMVYNRQHERCQAKGCRGTIRKAKLQGRSAFWCPVCQKKTQDNQK